ncbi:XPO4 (predicted) [Pycnogonum litorale]
MAEDVISELIKSANIMMATPGQITNEQRHSAEQVFLNFQKMKSPFMLCKHILENCQNDYVMFQTATLLRNGLVREWPVLSASDVESLRSYLLHYVSERTNIKSYVREQLTMVLAMMVKRGSIGSQSPERETILSEVSRLIASGIPDKQSVGCSILIALMNEYSNSVKSSDLGLTWEVHLRSKKNFEISDMKKIFQFCLEGLNQLENAVEFNADLSLLSQKILSICSQILMWNFQRIPISLSRRVVGLLEAQQTPSLRPPISWKDIFLKLEIIHIFFKLHWKLRSNPDLSHLTLQCIGQLASLNGAVVVQNDTRLRYLTVFMQNLLDMLSSCVLLDHEPLGLANIFNKLVLFYPPSLLAALPKNLQDTFFDKMTDLTCQFACKSAVEESDEEHFYVEAYGQILDGWVSILNDTQSFDQPFCKSNFIQMFNCYLQCHLSPPDGNRTQNGDNQQEIDEIEEDDRCRFKDQLSVIGCFGRKVLDHSLPVLFRLLEERANRLHGQLQRLVQDASSVTASNCTLTETLYEDLHWLLMVAGHLLMYDSEGETALIPAEINQYSLRQHSSSKTDVNVTLQVLASPSSQVSNIPGGDQTSDHVIRLISSVFRLCEVERRALESKMSHLLSPEVGTTLMWFLKRFSITYLLPDENCYSEISPTIVAAFGRDSDAGVWTLNFILSKICSNLFVWNSEPFLMDETIACLISLVDSPERSAKVIKNPEIWDLVRKESSNEIVGLQPKSKRGLYRSLVLAGSYSQGNRDNYFTQVLTPVRKKFQLVITRPDFNQSYKDESVKLIIMDVVESLIGIADGCEICSVNHLFPFLLPVFGDLITLMEVYHNYNQMVKLILEFYLSITKRMLCFINQENSKQLYDCCLRMIQVYAKHNTGKENKGINVEEEQFEDLQILMFVLIELLSKDILDFSSFDSSSESSSTNVCGADVALYGLNIIMPLMTIELLKFPSLCRLYYKLITFACQIYPSKIISLPPNLYNMLLESVQIGLTSFGLDITLLCLEFLADLSAYISRSGAEDDSSMPQRREMLRPVLKVKVARLTNVEFELRLVCMESTPS